MPDLFGSTEVLPSWLRDDPASRNQGFALGLQAAKQVQGVRQQAIENQRADRKQSMEEDAQQTRKQLEQGQIEAQRMQLDQLKDFSAETPDILKFGQLAQQAKTPEELDAISASFKPKTLAGQKAADLIRTSNAGRISKDQLDNYGVYLNQENTKLEMLYGPDQSQWPAAAVRNARFNATVKASPEAAVKLNEAESVAGIRADASIANATTRADASMANADTRAAALDKALAVKSEIAANALTSAKELQDERLKSKADLVISGTGKSLSEDRFVTGYLPHLKDERIIDPETGRRRLMTDGEKVALARKTYTDIHSESNKPVQAPAQVTTKEQFDALPPGTEYIGKNGGRFRKP